MALIAIITLSQFFMDLEDRVWKTSTTQELVAGILATLVSVFMLAL